MRCQVIVNPNAGRRQVQKNLERILGRLALEQQCAQIDVCRTREAKDAWRAAAALKPEEYDFVLGCGGDGTLNEIVNGLMEGGSRLPLALLPAGTVNDFAHHLHLPTQPEEFCEMIRRFTIREVDLGWANGYYFVNVAAFGMFTDVAYKTRASNKSVLGKLAYYLQGVRDVPEQLFNLMDLEVVQGAANSRHQALVCIIANSTSVGGARNIIPKARVDDGLLDMLLVTKPERISLEAIFDSLNTGDFRIGAVHQSQVQEVSFFNMGDEPIDIDLDGEYRGQLPLAVKVAPQALRLLVPPGSAAEQPPLEPADSVVRGLRL